jgi:cell division GTPase FtsZ
MAALTAATVVAVVAFVVAGCGGSTAASATPTPTPSQSSITARVLALKDYLGQVKPITDQLATTVASLPGAVKGTSAKPGATWTTAATNLDATATQMGTEAASLAALTPPAALQSTQDAAVKAIQSVQTNVSDAAKFLNEKVAKAGTTKASIEAQLSAAQTQLSGAAAQLTSAIQSLILSPDATPTP